jgi:hypothetical protein
MAYRSFERFWQARHPPRYAAFLSPPSPNFGHSSNRPDLARKLIRLRYPRKLPVVLSPDEAARLIAATTCLKHRAEPPRVCRRLVCLGHAAMWLCY